jgi:hypothetical protein
LGTPTEDATSIAAVMATPGVATKILTCIGVGIDTVIHDMYSMPHARAIIICTRVANEINSFMVYVMHDSLRMLLLLQDMVVSLVPFH